MYQCMHIRLNFTHNNKTKTYAEDIVSIIIHRLLVKPCE